MFIKLYKSNYSSIIFSEQAQEYFFSILRHLFTFHQFFSSMLRFQQPLKMPLGRTPILFSNYWYYLHILISSSWYLHQKLYFIILIYRFRLQGYEFFWHNLDILQFVFGGFGFIASYFELLPGSLRNQRKFARSFINLTILAFEAADLWDKKIDFIILGSYFGLKLSVSLLKLCVLPWFCFAHYSTFLIESLYFAAQNDNFAGKFISKRFFTLKFLFIWFQSSLIALDISQ